jgi:hypothetical protein
MGSFKEGQIVRYVGPCPEIAGKIGTFAWLADYDIYCGVTIGNRPGFVDRDGSGYFVELEELEGI